MKKILIVEDDGDARDVLKITLSEYGYWVVLAENGQLGLKAVREELPDLIITDLAMPVMDGLSFVRELKGLNLKKQIPVIVFSGRDGMRDSMALEGFGEFLDKPCRAPDLIARIEHHLKLSTSQDD